MVLASTCESGSCVASTFGSVMVWCQRRVCSEVCEGGLVPGQLSLLDLRRLFYKSQTIKLHTDDSS